MNLQNQQQKAETKNEKKNRKRNINSSNDINVIV